MCISRLPKPTLASCCRRHLFCARETHHPCDPPAHSRMLSLACRRPWPWNSLCRTQSCRCLADTLQMLCVPSCSHSLLSRDGRHDNTTYVHVHVHRHVQACCDVLLVQFPPLHCCQCFPEYPALHSLLAGCAGCVALTPTALQQPSRVHAAAGCVALTLFAAALPPARRSWRCAPLRPATSSRGCHAS